MTNCTPVPGATCMVMIKEDYEYKLSGDCSNYCICGITRKACLGRVVEDPDDASSQFFSRGKCMIDPERLNSCPIVGLPEELMLEIVKTKNQLELENKMRTYGFTL